jgi:hypothetical protein
MYNTELDLKWLVVRFLMIKHYKPDRFQKPVGFTLIEILEKKTNFLVQIPASQ